MPRAQKVLPKGAAGETRRGARIDGRSNAPSQGPAGEIIDTLLLKYEDRCRQQGFAFGGKGTCVEFDFPAPPSLRTDDLLVLDDGKLVEVVADIEPVLEVRATDFTATAPSSCRSATATSRCKSSPTASGCRSGPRSKRCWPSTGSRAPT